MPEHSSQDTDSLFIIRQGSRFYLDMSPQSAKFMLTPGPDGVVDVIVVVVVVIIVVIATVNKSYDHILAVFTD